jgi:hypothetical protein
MSQRYAVFMRRTYGFLFGCLALSGCLHISMDPIEINHNLNVNVRLDKALDDFFGDIDQKSTTIAKPAK